MADHEINDEIKIKLKQLGKDIEVTLVLKENPQFVLSPFEHKDMKVTDQIKQFRLKWLSPKADPSVMKLAKQCPVCKRQYKIDNSNCSIDGEELTYLNL